MKTNTLSVVASLVAMGFSQFASPAALTALCSHVSPEDNVTSVLKLVIDDNWKQAVVTAQDGGGIDFSVTLLCDGPKTINEEFTCAWEMDMVGIGRTSLKFLRDVQDKMTLVQESQSVDEETPATRTLECVKE